MAMKHFDLIVESILREGLENLQDNVDEEQLLYQMHRDKGAALWYFGKKFGKKIKELKDLGKSIYYIRDENSNGFIVNNEGNEDFGELTPDMIHNDSIRATYFNQKFGTDYLQVGQRDYGEGTALAVTRNGKKLFINKEGEADTSKIDSTKKFLFASISSDF